MTPAVEQLRTLGIEHAVSSYDPPIGDEPYGEHAARELGVEPETVFKTLMAVADDEPVVAVVPVPATLDLKALARAAGAKKAALAEPAAAERHSGYVLGGVSPFGQRQPSRTFVDEWATALDVVHVSGGRRGLELTVAPEAFTTALSARFAPIASWP